jgi:hypothetical protein
VIAPFPLRRGNPVLAMSIWQRFTKKPLCGGVEHNYSIKRNWQSGYIRRGVKHSSLIHQRDNAKYCVA